MSKPKWTRVGVQHLAPRWYWVRYANEPKGMVRAVQLVRGRVYWHENWIAWDGMERWSAPIKEPA